MIDTTTLVIATAAKIGFVLVIIFTFAPVLVWAERRQSAMMQDRIGPVRAGFTVPPIAKTGAMILALLATSVWIAAVFGALVHVRNHPPEMPGGLDPGFGELFAAFLGNPLFAITTLGVALHIGLYALVAWLADTQKPVTLLGLLHPLADALKFVWKEDFVPPKADKFLHAAAPIVTLIPAIVIFAVVPFGGLFYWEHLGDYLVMSESGQALFKSSVDGVAVATEAVPVALQVASLNVGILFLFAVAGTGVVGAAIAGYSSDNKYALLGGLRAAGQMVSYEVTLGLTLVPAFMLYGTLLPEGFVNWQMQHGLWGIVPLLPSFVLFLACSIAETKRIPFDLPEAESELVAGYFTEYSGMKFGMFFMAEFIEVVVLSAVMSTLFFGGFDAPFLRPDGTVGMNLTWLAAFGIEAAREWSWVVDGVHLPHGLVIASQVGAWVVKLVLLIWFQLQIRWTLPRFRYDQIMRLCWQYILPISLGLIFVYGIAIWLLSSNG